MPRKIDPQALAAWKGTDAAFAAQVGCTPQAVSLARQRATQAAPLPVRKPLGRRVQTAVLAEAERRGIGVLQVMHECRVALCPIESDEDLQAEIDWLMGKARVAELEAELAIAKRALDGPVDLG